MTSLAVLLSPAGQELLDRLSGEDVTAEQALRLAERLRGSYPPDLVAAALTEQALRMSARAKFSRAEEMLFTRDGLEQASSEQAAAHSAARMRDYATVADLCCGIGGNLAALAAGSRVLAVDRDLTSLEFARHNAAVSGAAGPVLAVCADVRQLVADSRGAAGRGARRAGPAGRGVAGGHGIGAVFIDPARRAGGRRLRAGLSEPPLDWCLRLPDWVPAVGIKAAPGLPLELVPPGWEVEFLAVGRGLKEALLWSPALASAPRRATILPASKALTPGTTLTPGSMPTPAAGCALVDLGDLGVAHHPLDRVVADVAVAAQQLHRVGGDLHGHVRGEALARRGHERQVRGPLARHGPLGPGRRGVGELPGRLDLHGHVGQHELHALELGDGLAELPAAP